MKKFYFQLRELRNDSDGQTIEFQQVSPDGNIGEPLIETFPDAFPDMGLVALFAFEVIGECKVTRLVAKKGKAVCEVIPPHELLKKPCKYEKLLSKNVFTAN